MAQLTCTEYTAMVADMCEQEYMRLSCTNATIEQTIQRINDVQWALDTIELSGMVPFASRRASVVGKLSGARKYRRMLDGMPRRG